MSISSTAAATALAAHAGFAATEPTPSAPAIPDVLHRLRTTFATGKTHSIEWRLHQLRELARMMRDHEQDFGDALRADLGKCSFEAVLT